MYSLVSLSLCLLLATTLASLIFPAWRISRSAGRLFLSDILSIGGLSPGLQIVRKTSERQRRQAKWITLREFEALLKRAPRDFIVIDLRPDAPRSPFPAADVFVLAVAPNELTGVLEWLPADRSAAFCGISDLGVARVQTSSAMEGSAPFYFLADDFDSLEAA